MGGVKKVIEIEKVEKTVCRLLQNFPLQKLSLQNTICLQNARKNCVSWSLNFNDFRPVPTATWRWALWITSRAFATPASLWHAEPKIQKFRTQLLKMDGKSKSIVRSFFLVNIIENCCLRKIASFVPVRFIFV
jgi:hypothetical protein